MDRLAGLPTFSRFDDVVDPDLFAPLPDDWVMGLCDVVDSTAAIREGRYKTVNIAGAAAISAIMNALQTRHFAFAFGGDGSAFALPPSDAALAERTLAATSAWVRDDLGLTLRTALVGVGAIRAAGHDVRAALYHPTDHVAYAMFDGGGLAWAETEMKAGRLRIEPLGPGARPDLTGLSCRWLPIKARHGAIVSIIVRPRDPGPRFRRAVADLLALLADGVQPVPDAGPPIGIISPGNRLEALATRGDGPLWRRSLAVAAHHLMGWAFFRTGLRAGAFDPTAYRAMAASNADTRKFDDGLYLTADCDAALTARVRAFLEGAAREGILQFGLVEQDAALMTCVVPSYQDHGHYHFIDGAGGGYAAAAKSMI